MEITSTIRPAYVGALLREEKIKWLICLHYYRHEYTQHPWKDPKKPGVKWVLFKKHGFDHNI